jgi:hypothetical protein
MLQTDKLKGFFLESSVTLCREHHVGFAIPDQYPPAIALFFEIPPGESGRPGNEIDKSLHTTPFIVELLIVAKIEPVEFLEELKDNLTRQIGIAHGNLQLLAGSFQGRIANGVLIEPIIAQGTAELTQHLRPQILGDLPLFIYFEGSGDVVQLYSSSRNIAFTGVCGLEL